MTLFLIVLIVFFAIWGWQKLSASANETERKKNTKTNVKLQKEILNKWYDEVNKKLNHVRPDVKSVYKYLVDYTYDCNLPYKPDTLCEIPNHEKVQAYYEKEKSISDALERRSEEMRLKQYAVICYISYRNHPEILEMSDEQRTEYFKALGDEEIMNRYKIYLEKINNFQSREGSLYWLRIIWNGEKINDYYSAKPYDEARNSYLCDEHLISHFINAFGESCPPLPNVPPKELYSMNQTLLQRLIDPFPKYLDGFFNDYPEDLEPDRIYSSQYYGDPNQVAFSVYMNMVRNLTMREMRSLGYAMSPDDIHESDWQEREKEHEYYDEQKKKYPWYYDDKK